MASRRNPQLYHEHVKKLMEHGFPENIAWPIVNEQIALGCLTGKTTLPTMGGGKQKLTAEVRENWCAAYSEWKKTHTKGTGFGKKPGRG